MKVTNNGDVTSVLVRLGLVCDVFMGDIGSFSCLHKKTELSWTQCLMVTVLVTVPSGNSSSSGVIIFQFLVVTLQFRCDHFSSQQCTNCETKSCNFFASSYLIKLCPVGCYLHWQDHVYILLIRHQVFVAGNVYRGDASWDFQVPSLLVLSLTFFFWTDFSN